MNKTKVIAKKSTENMLLVERQLFQSVIEDIRDRLDELEMLSEEGFIKDMNEALDDVKKGRVHSYESLEEFKKKFGVSEDA